MISEQIKIYGVPRINANTSALTSDDQVHGQQNGINIILPNQLFFVDVHMKILPEMKVKSTGSAERFCTEFGEECTLYSRAI